MEQQFSGFPRELGDFFASLKRNNSKEWFDAHRGEYEEYVLGPSRLFVSELGKRLSTPVPDIQAVPQVNKSLFRINRDIRFSKDKSPYKTNMGIFLWEGENKKRMECSGFYVHFEPGNFFLGGGMHRFPPDILEKFRGKVSESKAAKELNRIIDAVTEHPGMTVGGAHYKRVPRGYEAKEFNGKLLLYNGLFASKEPDSPDVFFTPELPAYCLTQFKHMLPLHKWIINNLIS